MKHHKLGLNHQNQNFVLIMTTDDGGGVLVLDVGWWETQGIVTEGFQIFLNLLKYFCFQIFFKPTCMRGGEKGGTKVTLEFIPSKVYISNQNWWMVMLYTLWKLQVWFVTSLYYRSIASFHRWIFLRFLPSYSITNIQFTWMYHINMWKYIDKTIEVPSDKLTWG